MFLLGKSISLTSQAKAKQACMPEARYFTPSPTTVSIRHVSLQYVLFPFIEKSLIRRMAVASRCKGGRVPAAASCQCSWCILHETDGHSCFPSGQGYFVSKKKSRALSVLGAACSGGTLRITRSFLIRETKFSISPPVKRGVLPVMYRDKS